ncbi:5-oxoprolinase subunit PxpB [Chelatococcus asaccharovorans]|uniref:KipI family sensor histidine kinase inhibitor n=1 Tax=Chelatococcus asaccharovorans TaxID=28210 RepID=A0A2V3U2Y1_9HYPH|nr:5-oxoprolinase subunit PxpB [Chelatococcus asaccharovorans]MBS7702802.1 5-oxoprolinase subunit PxpB [Chelatococcus asaccharovorans]PXW57094.1 KipI family sensor histidine kinase inhibitor [Chelatococcus asaccharovorans]
MSSAGPCISLLGTTAVLLEAPGAMDLPTQRRIWNLAALISGWPGVREAIPGVTNLMVTFISPPSAIGTFVDALRDAWDEAGETELVGREVEMAVTYGGELGFSLHDVAEHTGLSIDEVVARHAAPLYVVFALGSHPGYCYLGGMDPSLTVPRRRSPLQSVAGGSVSIGGSQTGVAASPGPSGWHTIGHTRWTFFDPSWPIPAALAPGDRVRFKIERVIR